MFNEANSVENYICDLLCGLPAPSGGQPAILRERPEPYAQDSIALGSLGLGWRYLYCVY